MRSLDQRRGRLALDEPQFVNALVGDGGHDQFSPGQLDHHLAVDGTFVRAHDDAAQRIAGTCFQRQVGGHDDPRRLDQGVGFNAFGQRQLFGAVVGDDRGQGIAAADVENDFSTDRAMLDRFYPAEELIACACFHIESPDNFVVLFKVIHDLPQGREDLFTFRLQPPVGTDDAAAIGGQARTAAMLAAGLTFDDRLFGHVVHAFHRLPGRFVTHAHVVGGGADRTAHVDALEQFKVIPAAAFREQAGEWGIRGVRGGRGVHALSVCPDVAVALLPHTT